MWNFAARLARATDRRDAEGRILPAGAAGDPPSPRARRGLTSIRRLWILLAAVASAPACVFVYDRTSMIYWVGHAGLEVEFAVTDAATGEPVGGAEVAVSPWGEPEPGREEGDFTLAADAGGVARRTRREVMCSGVRSALGFTDTSTFKRPRWSCRASAPGYEPGDVVRLDARGSGLKAVRAGPGAWRLAVPLALRRARPQAGP